MEKSGKAPKITPDQSEEIKDVYAPHPQLTEIKEHKNKTE